MSDLIESLRKRISKKTSNTIGREEYRDPGSLVINGIDLRSKEEGPGPLQIIPEVGVIVRVRPSAGYFKSITRREKIIG